MRRLPPVKGNVVPSPRDRESDLAFINRLTEEYGI